MELTPVVARVLLGSGADPAPYECRTCGTSLEEETAECPCCGAAEVVRVL